MPKGEREIVLEDGGISAHPDERISITWAQYVAALAEARAEQHAECVRLLRLQTVPAFQHYFQQAADWLEHNKP